MPTTSNFGWTTPADTDLVKDGAAAIRTLGNGIDTSLVDLKGGTTGQILSKASNTDLDYTWITNDVGDITAVTAGTGISGGGTSGAVTITNSMATEITAAGDLIVGTGSGTFDNLPIGTTGQVLTADTTVSPYKVKWASPAATGSNWSLLNSGGTALTAATTITISSISGRDSILILITGASAINASQAYSIRINGDTASNYTNYFVENSVLSPYNPQFIYSASETTDKINIAATSNSAACAVNGYILISGCNAAGVKTFTGAAGTDYGTSSPTGGNQRFFGGIYTGSSTVSSVSVVTAGSNFDAGTVYVYATN